MDWPPFRTRQDLGIAERTVVLAAAPAGASVALQAEQALRRASAVSEQLAGR
jgi:hypothetical protein